MTTGSAARQLPAARAAKLLKCEPWNVDSPTVTVYSDWFETITSGSRNEFQVHRNTRAAMTLTAGATLGTRIRHSRDTGEAPSISALSDSDRGMDRNATYIQNVPNAMDWATCGRIIAQYVLMMPTVRNW